MDNLAPIIDNNQEASEIANSFSHIFPLLAISAGTISVILIVYFFAAIIFKIKNYNDSVKMQKNILAIRQMLEGSYDPQAKKLGKIHLAHGAIKDNTKKSPPIDNDSGKDVIT